jgi:hypothetical protein
MATKEQLKALRKKHHLGEFRNNKKRSSVIRHSTRTKMVRRTHHKRSSGVSNSSVMTTLGASFAYGALRPTLAGAVNSLGFQPLGAYTTPAVLGVGGFMLSKQKGFIGAVGKVAMIVEVAGLGATMGSSLLGNASSSTTVDQSSYL